ncbi:hypothetical protein [Pinibacter soli]|uniref:TMhelix containing protein n=1 Tax=Pinibacter soli TaxID=3044211 RepID=A0ABT6REQ5_9BACT|nr:hypothetical protein [Pinibacter soli]MDI3321027.1 hypothetical protein [Pinibacter soli]
MYKEYYSWLLAEYGAFWISVGFLLIVLMFRFFVMIPFQLLIIKASDSNETHYVSCKITNINTGKRLIYYDFMGNTTRFHYDFAVDTPYTFKKNYVVEIGVRKSLWDTYLVTSEKLVHN